MIKTLKDMAHTTARSLKPLRLLMLLPFLGACSDYDESYGTDQQQKVPLTFYLQTAGSHQTRAYLGNVVAESAAESAINSIQVWFFDGTENVAYSNVIEQVEEEYKVTISVPDAVIQKGSVDAYIIANASSALTTTLNESSSLADIQ